MEAMAGYDRAIVIDAMVSGGRPGTIYRLGLEDLPKTRNTDSTHDASLPVALELGRRPGLQLPGDVRIWAVEAADVETFGERLTPDGGSGRAAGGGRCDARTGRAALAQSVRRSQ